MRGKEVLHNKLISRPESEATSSEGSNLARRNLYLCLRYYYHVELCKTGYEASIAKLEQEFYLSQARIIVLLTEHVDTITAMIKKQLPLPDLKKQVPHYNWAPPIQVVKPQLALEL